MGNQRTSECAGDDGELALERADDSLRHEKLRELRGRQSKVYISTRMMVLVFWLRGGEAILSLSRNFKVLYGFLSDA